jgi:positive regulator of sigma E activity
VVECLLAKEKVAGSNPVSRSKMSKSNLDGKRYLLNWFFYIIIVVLFTLMIAFTTDSGFFDTLVLAGFIALVILGHHVAARFSRKYTKDQEILLKKVTELEGS